MYVAVEDHAPGFIDKILDARRGLRKGSGSGKNGVCAVRQSGGCGGNGGSGECGGGGNHEAQHKEGHNP
jgi:hypothetical protein